MSRKVIYFVTTENKKKEINSSAMTWGELKTQLGLDSVSGMKYVLKDPKTVLEFKDTVLPEGDITIFGLPSKNSSGASKSDVVDSIRALRKEFNEQLDYILEEVLETDSDSLDEEDCGDCDDLADEAEDIASELDN